MLLMLILFKTLYYLMNFAVFIVTQLKGATTILFYWEYLDSMELIYEFLYDVLLCLPQINLCIVVSLV